MSHSARKLQIPLAGLFLFGFNCCVLAALANVALKYRTFLNLDRDLGIGRNDPGYTIFGIISFIIGLALICWVSHDLGWWWSSRSWAVAESRIISAAFEPNSEGSDDPSP